MKSLRGIDGFAPLLVIGVVALIIIVGVGVWYIAMTHSGGSLDGDLQVTNTPLINTPSQPVSELKSEQAATNSVATSQPPRVVLGPVSYQASDTLFNVTTTTVPVLSEFDPSDMADYSSDCGSNKSEAYFTRLLSDYSASDQAIQYNFNYIGQNNNNAYTVTLIPNKPGYTTLADFESDFRVCDAEMSLYPMTFDKQYLVFMSSCGGGGVPDGCGPVRYFVGPTIQLVSPETSGWNEYVSDNNDFSFQYPSDLLINGDSNTSSVIFSQNTTSSGLEAEYDLAVSIIKNPGNLSMQQYFSNDVYDNGADLYSRTTISTTTVAALPAAAFSGAILYNMTTSEVVVVPYGDGEGFLEIVNNKLDDRTFNTILNSFNINYLGFTNN